jgi:hypothetical protein
MTIFKKASFLKLAGLAGASFSIMILAYPTSVQASQPESRLYYPIVTSIGTNTINKTIKTCRSLQNPGANAFPIINSSPLNKNLQPQVLLAGYDNNGCNWFGSWLSQWTSSTGWYTGVLNLDYGTNGISGTYNNGTIEGLYVNGDFSKVRGVWKRTKGNSGGACQYGNFEFSLSFSFPTGCQIYGWWDYCGTGERWLWNSSQAH